MGIHSARRMSVRPKTKWKVNLRKIRSAGKHLDGRIFSRTNEREWGEIYCCVASVIAPKDWPRYPPHRCQLRVETTKHFGTRCVLIPSPSPLSELDAQTERAVPWWPKYESLSSACRILFFRGLLKSIGENQVFFSL